MKKIVLLNGPARSGKDYSGSILMNAFHNRKVEIMKFAEPLKLATHELYGFHGYPIDAFEKVKDVPHEGFFGMTPRQAYIRMSEEYLKPLHGKDVFGKIAGKKVRRSESGLIVFTDSGFSEEAIALFDEVDRQEILLIRLHGWIEEEKRWRDFSGDSRDFIELPGVTTYEISNFYNQDFAKHLIATVGDWL